MMADTLPTRDQIDPTHKWTAPSVLESADAWRAEFDGAMTSLKDSRRTMGIWATAQQHWPTFSMLTGRKLEQ